MAPSPAQTFGGGSLLWVHWRSMSISTALTKSLEAAAACARPTEPKFGTHRNADLAEYTPNQSQNHRRLYVTNTKRGTALGTGQTSRQRGPPVLAQSFFPSWVDPQSLKLCMCFAIWMSLKIRDLAPKYQCS